MKATKTFKIGEYAKGGVITVEINGNGVTIIGKYWDSSTGFSKKSNQSNAKEFTRFGLLANEREVEWQLKVFLSNLTTVYYADKIMEWIKSKIDIGTNYDY